MCALKKVWPIVLLLACVYSSLSAQSEDGSQVQVFTIHNDSTITRAGVFIDDVSVKYDLDRFYYSFYRERIIKTQGSHLGRLLEGKFQRMSRDLELLEEGYFEEGLKVGQWKHWKDGRLYQLVDYRKGVRHGQFVQYALNGQLEMETAYRNGLLHGNYLLYEEGKLISSRKFKQGEEQAKEEEQIAVAAKEEATTTPKAIADTTIVGTSSPDEKGRKQRRASRRSKKTIDAEVVELTVESADLTTVEFEDNNRETSQIFIIDKASGQGLEQVAIKVSQFESASAENESFQFFGYTNAEGHCQLKNDGENYVLFITHSGYQPYLLRIEAKHRQDNYLVALEPTPTCGQLVGRIQPAAKNMAVGGAAIHIKDSSGHLIKTTYSSSRGTFEACLPCNERYQFIVEGEGFLPYEEHVFLPANCIDETEEVALYLQTAENRFAPSQVAATPDTQSAKNAEPLFFVVAGTFSHRLNAEERLEEAQNAGFEDAHIIELSNSGYYVVCVGNLDTLTAAAALKQQFERLTQIDAYVRDEPF